MTYDNVEFLGSLCGDSDFHEDPTPDPDTIFPHFLEIADRLVDLYVSYRQKYVMMVNGAIFIPKKRDSGTCKLTNSIVCKHLRKKFSIGVFAGPYSSKFVCFDVDDGNQDTVRKIISLCEKFGISKEFVYVSSSGGKGYHVEIFFDSLVYTEKLRIFYDWVILQGGLDARKVEFRPTFSQAIKLPLSVHVKTGNICWFVNRVTFEPYEYDDYVLQIKQVSAETFNSLVGQCSLRKPVLSDELDDVLAKMNPEYPRTRFPTTEEQQIITGVSSHPSITQPGQRHALARAIAIHNRRGGMSLEESEADLIHWWNVQDKSVTTTPDKEALQDIHELVKWTFSDAFIIPNAVKKLEITKDMLRASLSMKTKTEKKFMFLLCCYCNVYGRMNMGYERIAKFLNCSAITVRGIVSQLANEGWIKIVSSKTTFENGQYTRKPNTYYVGNEVFASTKDLEINFIFRDPLVYEAQECSRPGDDGRMRTIIPELEPEGFNDFYYLTMAKTIAEKDLKNLLSRSEIKTLRERKVI